MADLRQADNKVVIEGTLSEVDLRLGSNEKNGATNEYVAGSIKVRVVQNGETLEVPVHMYSNKLTNAGKPNPAYDSIVKVMDLKSIAAVGIEAADKVRINAGNIKMNDYWRSETELSGYPRVNASFVSKVTNKEESKDQATFTIQFAVQSIVPDVDTDGVENGRLKIKGVVPLYGGKVDVVEFVATSDAVKDAINQYWKKGDSVNANGRLRFTSETTTTEVQQGFGDPIIKTSTKNLSDLVITGGSQVPLEGDFAWDKDELNKALTERDAYLESRKAKDLSKTKQTAAPVQGLGSDLGF